MEWRHRRTKRLLGAHCQHLTLLTKEHGGRPLLAAGSGAPGKMKNNNSSASSSQKLAKRNLSPSAVLTSVTLPQPSDFWGHCCKLPCPERLKYVLKKWVDCHHKLKSIYCHHKLKSEMSSPHVFIGKIINAVFYFLTSL